jgi:transposase
MKKYKVTLRAEERNSLQDLIAAGKGSAQKLAHARILLKADAAPGGPAWRDARIAEAVEVNVTTVERIRERFVEHGLEAALVRKQQDRPSRERKLDGQAEARLVALACSDPPLGRARWTLRLLADQLVELEVVDTVSTETVRQVLKKMNSSRGGRSSGASRRRRTPNSSVRWRTCWRSTTGPTTRSGRWSAWTKRASN